MDIENSQYKYIRLASTLVGERSLIEKLSYDGQTGRKAFHSLLDSDNDVSGDGFELKHITMTEFISKMNASPVFNKLLSKLEPRLQVIYEPVIPKRASRCYRR